MTEITGVLRLATVIGQDRDLVPVWKIILEDGRGYKTQVGNNVGFEIKGRCNPGDRVSLTIEQNRIIGYARLGAE